jgi:uncharacterized protein YecE (DUF72 family)
METTPDNPSLHVGTSGWMYKDWGNTFYPPDLKTGHLPYFASEFSTVEVNTTFYHLPRTTTFQKWYKETPDHFVFSLKLSRYITHKLKLEQSREPLSRFMCRAVELREKLGPVLIQLPPFLRLDSAVFSKFLKSLAGVSKRTQTRFALEPRHHSWIENAETIRSLLKPNNIALVFPHSSKIPSFEPIDENLTANFAYIRFHGPSEFAASRYGAARLRPWATRIRAWKRKGLDVFVYFNNDVHGHAIHDARSLLKLIERTRAK